MTGLVGWWPLHRTVGDAVDLSGEGNHGTITGATRGVAGRGGLQAFSFDGVDDLVNFGDFFRPGTGPFSYSIWVRPDAALDSFNLPFDRTDADPRHYERIRVDSSTPQYFATDDAGNADAYLEGATGDVPQEEWTHLAITHNPNTPESVLYVNGNSVDTNTTATFNHGQVAPYAAGHSVQQTDNGPWPGQIFGVRIYDRTLSATEVATLYDWGGGDYAQPPSDLLDADAVSYWPLDEDSGTTATDVWGSNDGTITGATVGVNGVRDTAYSFDGTDDYLNVGNDTSLNPRTGSFTFTSWFKFPSTGSFRELYGTNWDQSKTVEIRKSSSETMTALIRDGTYENDVSSSETLSTGEWRHIAVVRDTSRMESRLYLNADLDSRSPFSNTADINSTSDYNIGRRGGVTPKFYYNGELDDVRYYNRKLSPAEIHEVYQYGTFGRDLRKKTVNAR